METINLSDIIDETTKSPPPPPPPPPSQSIVGNKSGKRESNVTIKSTLSPLAVHMKNVSFNYGTSIKPLIALNTVNVHIPEGIIYGLLGPSGCGKTTLLRCILGRLKPQSGDIQINGFKPGTRESLVPGPGVGYMPQELALYMQFTVKETINYFGQLTGIPKEERHSRVDFLLSFLDLTDPDRMVSDLSGGQRRRVSLAVALVHKPPLLILDEPTVGVDPLLRESIWSHLVHLTQSEGMTAIITTHYIEEARQANVVGLMREGSLLVEENPDYLMRIHQKDSLEGIFLKICHEQRTSTTTSNSFIRENGGPNSMLTTINNLRSRQSTESTINSTKNITKEVGKWKRSKVETGDGDKSEMVKDACRKIGALTEKMAIRLRRNIPMLTFQLVLPTIQIILFCVCIGQEPKNLDLAVYNGDYKGSNYSEQFLQLIDPNYIRINYVNSKEAAIDRVKEGWAHGALIFNPNYSLQLDNRFDMFEMMTDAKGKIINESTIYFHSDGTEFPIQITLLTQLITSAQKWVINLVNESFPFMASAIAEPLFRPVDPPIYGELKPSYRNFMAPGLILGISYILAVGLTALCFVMDRKEGLLERTFVAGVQAYQILFSHIIIQCTIILIQTILLLFTIFVIFGIDLNGSIISVTVLTLLQGIAGMSFGFLISALCYEEQSAMLISVGSFYPNLILCGILWPLEAMPDFMREMSYLMPQTLAIKSMRYIITRGWEFTRFEVYIGFFATGCWILIFNILAVIIFAVKK